MRPGFSLKLPAVKLKDGGCFSVQPFFFLVFFDLFFLMCRMSFQPFFFLDLYIYIYYNYLVGCVVWIEGFLSNILRPCFEVSRFLKDFGLFGVFVYGMPQEGYLK